MGNGLLTSMALTDAWENQSLNRGLKQANTRIEELEGSVAANLLEKLVLRRALSKHAPDHPLLKKINQEKMHNFAERIIASPNSTFNDVRAAAEKVNF